MKGWWCCAARKVTLASQRVLAAATRYTHIYETNVTCRLSATETRDRYQPWGAWDHLYFLGRCPCDTALAATPGTGQLQTGAYGIPSAERYGAIVPESTRSVIKPARPSPVTVVIHTTAARPVCQQSAVARFLLQPQPSGTLYLTTYNLHHLLLPFAGS